MTSLFSNPLPAIESTEFAYICRECGHVVDREDLVSAITTPDLTPAFNPKFRVRVGHEPTETVACQSGQYFFLEAGSVGQLFIDINLHLAKKFLPIGTLKFWEANLIDYPVAATESFTIDTTTRHLAVRMQNNNVTLTVAPPDIPDESRSSILEAVQPYFLEIFIREHRNNCSVVVVINPTTTIFLETRDHHVKLAWTGSFFGWVLAGGNFLFVAP